jgi:hypothetical protein
MRDDYCCGGYRCYNSYRELTKMVIPMDSCGSGEADGLSAVEADAGRLTLEKVFYPFDDLRRDPSLSEIVDESFVMNIIERPSDVHKYG